MKFQDIKVGDVVFVMKSVHYGYSSRGAFFVPTKVTKTTATQFTCDNDQRYRKDTGLELGGGYNDRSYLAGEIIHDEPVCDETEKMNDFKNRVSKLIDAVTLICEIDRVKGKIKPDIDQNLLDSFIEQSQRLLDKIKAEK